MEIQHPIHKHPIVLYDLNAGVLPCSLCGNPMQFPPLRCTTCNYSPITFCLACDDPIAGPVYTCSRDCHFFLHQSCLGTWPAEIRHPFHPIHPLSRHLKSTHKDISEFECDSCNRWTRRFVYQCSRGCDFRICLRCAPLCLSSSTPLLSLRDGKHHLFLYENTTFEKKCTVCNHTDQDTSIFACTIPNCGYAVHLTCSSLRPRFPEIIKNDQHFHAVTLAEFVREEGWTEYYCDACELPRDPAHPVYHCPDCHFAAHVGCILSEVVLPSLIEEHEAEAKARGFFVDPWVARLDEEIQMLCAKETEVRSDLEAVGFNLGRLDKERSEYISRLKQQRLGNNHYLFDPLGLQPVVTAGRLERLAVLIRLYIYTWILSDLLRRLWVKL